MFSICTKYIEAHGTEEERKWSPQDIMNRLTMFDDGVEPIHPSDQTDNGDDTKSVDFTSIFSEEIEYTHKTKIPISGCPYGKVFDGVKFVLSTQEDDLSKDYLSDLLRTGYIVDDQRHYIFQPAERIRKFDVSSTDLWLSRHLCCPESNEYTVEATAKLCRYHVCVEASTRVAIESFSQKGFVAEAMTIPTGTTHDTEHPMVSLLFKRKGDARTGSGSFVDNLLKARLRQLGLKNHDITRVPTETVEALSKLQQFEAAASISVMRQVDLIPSLPKKSQAKPVEKPKPKPQPKTTTAKKPTPPQRKREYREPKFERQIQSQPVMDPMLATLAAGNPTVAQALLMQRLTALENRPVPTNQRRSGNANRSKTPVKTPVKKDKRKKQQPTTKWSDVVKSTPPSPTSNNQAIQLKAVEVFGDGKYDTSYLRQYWKGGAFSFPKDLDPSIIKARAGSKKDF